MALVLKNGAVFLHIPKTGGNWIHEVLEKMNLVEYVISDGHKHVDVLHWYLLKEQSGWYPFQKSPMKEFVKYKTKQYFKKLPSDDFYMFCFVRHPLKWYESWFKYMSQEKHNWRDWGGPKNKNRWHPAQMLNGLGSNDFNTFMKNVLEARPGYVSEMYSWYVQPPMKFVGKQENLREDLIKVLDQLNLNYDASFIMDYGKVNVSEQRKIAWDDQLKEEIIKTEYQALKRHGYV